MPRSNALGAAILVATIGLLPIDRVAAQATFGDLPTPVTAPAAASPSAATPRPFKDIVKGAREIPGLFALYQKEDKVWLAIAPEQFDKPFLFTHGIPKSIGERGLYGGQMGGAQLAVWRKIGGQVQLVAKNTKFFAQQGTPQARFVAESFSDSLLASTSVVAAPHPDTKAILVEANSLLFGDIPGYLTRLEAAFRMPFTLDTRNTSIAHVNNTKDLTGIQVQAHFSVPKLSAPPMTQPAPPTPSDATWILSKSSGLTIS